MPTYHARGTTIQLSVADIDRSTTQNPINRQCQEAKEIVESNVLEFAKASKHATLNEDALLDARTSSHIRFLGTNEDMPFLLVRAGKTFFGYDLKPNGRKNRRATRLALPMSTVESTTEPLLSREVQDIDASGKMTAEFTKIKQSDGTESDPRYAPPLMPHALCLNIFLSPKSFLHNRDKVTGKETINDVKVDVYFNGTLNASTIVPSRFHSAAHSLTEHILRVSGLRISRILEKPWIFLPLGQNPDGTLRDYKRGKACHAGANGRWTAIAEALLSEADRLRPNVRGEKSIISSYLESIAKLDMPREVEEIHRSGSQSFGIIDVVLITGKGAKHGPERAYLAGVTPVEVLGFDTNTGETQSSSSVPTVSQMSATPSSSQKLTPVDVSGSDINRREAQSKVISPNVGQNSTFPPSSQKRAFSTPLNHLNSSLPAAEYSNKRLRTLEDQFASIEVVATAEAASIRTLVPSAAGLRPSLPRNTRSGSRVSILDSRSSSPLSSAPTEHAPEPTSAQRPKVVIYDKPRRAPSLPIRSSEPPILSTAQQTQPIVTHKKQEQKIWGYVPSPDANLDLDPRGVNEGCRVVYADPGIVRQVSVVRGASFREEGVIMGCRFVIG